MFAETQKHRKPFLVLSRKAANGIITTDPDSYTELLIVTAPAVDAPLTLPLPPRYGGVLGHHQLSQRSSTHSHSAAAARDTTRVRTYPQVAGERSLADGEKPLNHELNTLVDLSLVEDTTESLEDGV
jgi:hypothetical protein